MTTTIPSLLLGELTASEMKHVTDSQAAFREITFQIGNLEVKKAELISQLSDIQSDVNDTLLGAAVRLGLPNNEKWQYTSDGKIYRV